MTEASSQRYSEYVGDATIKVRPGVELAGALSRFIAPDYRRGMGTRALEMTSIKKIAIYDVLQDEDDPHINGISKADLSVLSRRLDERQRVVKPLVSRHVTAVKLIPPAGLEHEGIGIDLRFRLVIDELTRRLLAKTVVLEEQDGALYTHLALPRRVLQLGSDLQEARDGLLTTLAQQPQYVEELRIDSDVLKP
jgi:hypothetical protein